MYFHFLSFNFPKSYWISLRSSGGKLFPCLVLDCLVSNQPTVNFVSRFIPTKKKNSFRSFSFYLAFEIRSWQILPKTTMKHALFFPLEKHRFTSIRLYTWFYTCPLYLLTNEQRNCHINDNCHNNHNISKAPERHSLLIF